MLNVAIQSIMLNAVLLSVIMLIVVAPSWQAETDSMLFPSFESRVKINPRPRPSLKVIASSGNAVGRTIDY